MIYNEANFPELPRNWASISVDDSVESAGNSNKKLKSKDALDHGRFPVIDQGQSEISGYSDDESLVVEASESSPIILFGDHTRLLKKISQPFVPGADGTKLFRAKSFWDTRFVYQMLRAIKLPDKGYARHFQYLRDSVLPLPPLPEQKRIADKLDAVLAQVDACLDRLDRIPAILKRFRQSVLAAATSGKLTEDWREEPNAVDWQQTDVQSVAHVGTGSTPLRSNSTFFASTGTPWITSTATSQSLVTDAKEFVTQAAITAHRLKTYPIGTLLVAMYGEGKTRGQVTELGIPATINQACAAIVVNEEKALKNYVKLALQANYFEMRELAEGGNQPNLNLSKIKGFPLALPGITEQTEIVRRVEALFAYAVPLEAHYATARAQVEKLTPSMLAKAFRGELVPQDPNDEPASALLARIRATPVVKENQMKIPRKTPMEKHNTDTVKAIIQQMPLKRFSFDELRSQVTTDYESLKDIVFALLSESEPLLRQVFDEKAQAMCLEKVGR